MCGVRDVTMCVGGEAGGEIVIRRLLLPFSPYGALLCSLRGIFLHLLPPPPPYQNFCGGPFTGI